MSITYLYHRPIGARQSFHNDRVRRDVISSVQRSRRKRAGTGAVRTQLFKITRSIIPIFQRSIAADCVCEVFPAVPVDSHGTGSSCTHRIQLYPLRMLAATAVCSSNLPAMKSVEANIFKEEERPSIDPTVGTFT